MPKRRLHQIDGDGWMPGSLTVLGGINTSANTRNVTKVAQTEADVATVAGEVTGIDQRVVVVEDGVDSYITDAVPSNNPTALTFTDKANNDGTVSVVATWSYTQGTVEASGFMFFVKRSVVSGPGAISLAADPCYFVPFSTNGSYSIELVLNTRQIDGSNPTLPVYYRFGVIACAQRKSKTVFAAAGVVEDASWINKTFASKVMFNSANFWNLDTGEFKAGTAYKYFHVDPSNGTVELVNLNLTLTEAELITTDTESNTLTHELSRHSWKDATGAEKGRIGIEPGNNLVTSDRIYKQVTIPSSVANGDVLNYTTYNFSCHYYKGNIYIIPVGANKVQIYNISTNTMTDGATLGNYATRINSVIYKDKIYMVGSGVTPVEVYDITNNTVTEKATLGNYSRYTIQLYNDTIYMPSVLDTVMEIYDIISDTVRTTTIGNKRRYTSHIHNNKMYMPTSESTTLEIYDLVADTVSNGVAIGNYVRVTSILTGGKIYLIEDGGPHLEIYDIATNTVATHSILGSYNRSLSNLYSNKIYMPRSGGTSLETYDIASNTVSAGVTLANRLRYCSVQNAGKLYLPQSNGTGLEIVTIGEYDELGAGIIERGGSLATGKWTKYSDGTMKIRFYIGATTVTANGQTYSYTWPVAFVGDFPSCFVTTGFPTNDYSCYFLCANVSLAGISIRIANGATAQSVANVQITAHGEWR